VSSSNKLPRALGVFLSEWRTLRPGEHILRFAGLKVDGRNTLQTLDWDGFWAFPAAEVGIVP